MQDSPRVGARCSDQEGASHGNRNEFTLAIGSEGETRSDVCTGEIGKVSQDFGFRHAGGEIVQDVVYGNPQPANAELPTALSRLNRDVLLIVHNWTLRPGDPKVKLERLLDQFDVVAVSLPRRMAASRPERDWFRRLDIELSHYRTRSRSTFAAGEGLGS